MAKRRAKQEAFEELRKTIKPGDTVYTVLRHVSRSGMQRRIDLYHIHEGRLEYLSGYTSKLLGETLSKSGGIVVNGAGMDMGADLVMHLAYALFHEGEGYDKDAPYKLRQSWI